MEKQNDKIIFICYYAFFINGFTALIFGSIMPYILDSYNVGYEYGGLLLSLQSIGNLIASALTGIITVNLGFKKSSIILSLLIVLGFLLMLVTNNPIILLFTFLLTGLGRGSNSNISNTLVNDRSNGDTARLNMLHSFFAIGAFTAPFLSSWIINKGYNWKNIVIIITMLSSILTLSYLFNDVSLSENKLEEKYYDTTVRKKFKSEFYISAGILFCYVGVEYAVNGWIVTYLKDTNIMSTIWAQRVLSILWVVMIFGRLSTVYLGNILKKENILFYSSLGTLIFFTIFLFQKNEGYIILSILGLGLCLSTIYPTTIANISSQLKESSAAMGILLGIAGIGGIIFPYLTGKVANYMGMQGGMIVISIAVVLMFLLTVINKYKLKSNKKG